MEGHWVGVFLAGWLVLSVFVLLEVRLGLIAGGIADVAWLLVMALIGILAGIIRYAGRVDTMGERVGGSRELFLYRGLGPTEWSCDSCNRG